MIDRMKETFGKNRLIGIILKRCEEYQSSTVALVSLGICLFSLICLILICGGFANFIKAFIIVALAAVFAITLLIGVGMVWNILFDNREKE